MNVIFTLSVFKVSNMSASSISKCLSNKRITRQHSKDKPHFPITNLINVSDGDQTQSADYNMIKFVVTKYS